MAWVNAMSAGDRILMIETGWFFTLWSKTTKSLGFESDIVKGDRQSGNGAHVIEAKLLEGWGSSLSSGWRRSRDGYSGG